MLVYSERFQQAQNRLVPYFKMAKALWKNWPATLCSEAQHKLKSQEELSNMTITMLSHRQKCQESLMPKTSTPIEISHTKDGAFASSVPSGTVASVQKLH